MHENRALSQDVRQALVFEEGDGFQAGGDGEKEIEVRVRWCA